MKATAMIPSRFLKKEDVEPRKLVTITKLTEENVAPENQAAEVKWVMHFRELSKPLVLNSTNINACVQALGTDETDDWIGKQVVLYNDPNVSFGGKIVGGIRIRKPNLKPQPAKAPEPEFNDDLDGDTGVPF